jgi:dihydropteroate synthase
MSFKHLGLNSDETIIFGILNVTPDSFSDGGNFFNLELAIEQARKLKHEGAAVIDVGGESTRPGAERISSQEELKRVLPVIEALVAEEFIVSIDTMRAEVALAAAQVGAKFVNDVSGGKADSLMLKTVSDLNVGYILMHWRAASKEMDDLAIYQDVVKDVSDELEVQIEHALQAGISKDNLAIDPGLGFAKNPQHNWQILKNISKFQDLGYPLLVGHSRKRFINELNEVAATDLTYKDYATAAISYQLALDGVWAVRVHEAKPSWAAIAAASKFKREQS